VLPPADDTIAAVATAPGTAAVAVVRISGPAAAAIARRVTGRSAAPRIAELRAFKDREGAEIDRGLTLFFPAPHSYTGEDVVELHCHGGSVVVDWLLETIHAYGARPAGPGEFTLRAFLNDKLDLAQAEAIADLVASGSRLAARAAFRSLRGEFSTEVQAVQRSLTELRVLVEAWLDFPDEELDRGAATELESRARAIDAALMDLEMRAAQGAVLHDGLTVAIVGPPNAGKSSLLNRLAGYDVAIVTAIPGTTRDTIRERLAIDGLPVNVVDTAGLGVTQDLVELEGVRRAHREMEVADHVLWVADIREGFEAARADARRLLPPDVAFTLLLNKVDLVGDAPRAYPSDAVPVLEISALTGQGIRELARHLKGLAGWQENVPGTFSARRRHVDALAKAHEHVRRAGDAMRMQLEIAAEELRGAQTALGELTGELSSDDLLGEIFASFCIGK
jgi:tRNA modification GTPase